MLARIKKLLNLDKGVDMSVKSVIIGLIVGVLVTSGKVLWEDKQLDKVRYLDNPTCLMQRDGGEMYVILENDEEANAYKGVRILMVFQKGFKLPYRQLNERKDLNVVDCKTGEPK